MQIVTTTINPPTEALIKYAEMGIPMWVVGDMKTPHDLYKEFSEKYPHVTYLKPEKQDKLYHRLSDSIGWNCIQRRVIGFLEAYKTKDDIIATVDDDNIPLDDWGKEVFVGKEIEVNTFLTDQPVFDPLSVTNNSHLWHRGFPIQLMEKRLDHTLELRKMTVQVQANLWNGAPDIDAICRVSYPEDVEFTYKKFTSDKLCPFNSQNTFLSREALKYYYLFPHIGRMDDIWASYVLQEYMPNSVVYCKPSVFQKRNPHDIFKDLKDEMIGYEKTIELVNDLFNWTKYIPEETLRFVRLYTEAL